MADALFERTTAQPADWRLEADARIERLRKRDIEISVQDGAGKPIPRVRIDVRQIRKAFPFGAGMGRQLLQAPSYQKFFRSHFNWAVFSNEAKWYANEAVQGEVTYAQADALAAWCETHQLPVRGHCLFWEPEQWQPAWLAKLSARELRRAVEARLESATMHFRGKFRHWDVNNEMLHGSFFRDRLGPDIQPWMFRRVRELDPDVRLFINDFNVLSVDQNFLEVQTEAYVAHIRDLLQRGAPIDGIGIQGHVWDEDILSRPQRIRERLDRVAEIGLPLWITEFDAADADENACADKLEMIYRTAYSHPMVEGVMMWVVWAGDSWRGPNAGIVHPDGRLKAAGRRFESLMHEWSTQTSGVTDEAGRLRVRGFPGCCEVMLTVKGQAPVVCDLNIENAPDNQTAHFRLPPIHDHAVVFDAPAPLTRMEDGRHTASR